MPETSFKTEVSDVKERCQQVLELLTHEPVLHISSIQEELSVSKPQALTVLQRLESSRLITCRVRQRETFISLRK
ncbi:MAG TPA: hypothetical protein V6C85_26665 [Allocoleopsis sp.]